jgi:hypothetical protein
MYIYIYIYTYIHICMYYVRMCDSLIKCKIGIMNIVITIIYKSIHLLIHFTVSTINMYISESHRHKVPTLPLQFHAKYSLQE